MSNKVDKLTYTVDRLEVMRKRWIAAKGKTRERLAKEYARTLRQFHSAMDEAGVGFCGIDENGVEFDVDVY